MHTREPGTRSEPVRFTPADEQTMLEAAGAAPSVHNSQPWRFVIRPGSIEVLADPSRQLRYADSVGRSLLISCGAALFNLRVAAEHVGYHPRVRLLPDPGDPTLVGRLTFTHRHGRPGTLDALFPSVAVRRTNRAPFRNLALPATVLGRLAEAAQVENTALRIYSDPDEVARVVTLLHEAEVDEDRDPDRFVERATWVGTDRDDGLPPDVLGPRPMGRGVPFRDLGSGLLRRDEARFEKAPTIAVLSTSHDHPVDWVRAGQALERVLLVATQHDLAASFMNQPLEQPQLRWLVRSPVTGVGHAQMLMRIGYGGPVPPTPRRPLEDLVERRET